MTPTEAHAQRPRIEGDREREILEAALEVLADVGYDRLTMDAVATRARASKATLYRRWNTKVGLVIDALLSRRRRPRRPTRAAFAGTSSRRSAVSVAWWTLSRWAPFPAF